MSEQRQYVEQKKRILKEGFLTGLALYRAIEAGINTLFVNLLFL